MAIRIFTPREALEQRNVMRTWCECGCREVDLQALIDTGHGDVEFPELRRRLVCQGCRKHIHSLQVVPFWEPDPARG